VPHFTLQIGTGGPVLNVLIGVSEARAAALQAAGHQPPQPILIQALIDTGASCTCIEPSILTALQLSPIGQVPMVTPSTGNLPHQCDQYDVSLLIHGATLSAVPFYQSTLLVLAAMPDSLRPQGIEGLIGRDVLEHCLLQYNGTIGYFTLAY
jgi:hypothetical protein